MAKALVVDDDVDLATVVASLLEQQGWTAQVVHSGGDAEQLLLNFRYDLVLLDWDLPDISGLSVCAHRRKAGDKTPIIFITGKTEVTSLEKPWTWGPTTTSRSLSMRELADCSARQADVNQG